MRVNSAFRGFFINRLIVGSGITLVMFGIFFIGSSFTKHPDRDLLAKQVNLMIRQIGHQLLLQAGDSTSRVLPVTEIKEGTFLLAFENEFVFDHDSLMVLSQRLLPKTQFPSGYTVTVHECAKADIVYGFQVNSASPDILPCRGRSQPPGCYTIEFVFQDLYARVEQKKADVARLTDESQSFKADAREANATREEPQAFKADSRAATPTLEEPQSFKVGTQEGNLNSGEPESFKVDSLEAIPNTTIFDFPLMNLVFSGMLVLLGVTLLIGRFRKSLIPLAAQNQEHTIVKGSVSEVPPLGKFLFDAKDQRLLLGSEVISLTEKECRILELLHKNFGELIPRETLMQKVWISQGVITGRSLDMFVSKLRKKLSSDPELKITNVHGKGYKLEIPGMQM